MSTTKSEPQKQQILSEDEYDDIMRKAREIFEFRDSVDDPYAFHKAFEWANEQIEARERLMEKQ